MASQTAYRKRLKTLMSLPENQICSDCPERQPRWASLIKPPPGSPPGTLVIGAFCCLECSGSHRRLGVHISFVRSITLDQWKEAEVRSMENGGNEKVNAIFEAKLDAYRSQTIKPTTHANGATRERFIRDKYERRKYYDSEILRRYNEGELGDDSESESDDSDDSDDDDDRATNHQDARRRNRGSAAMRAPSEVARLRAEKIRQRQGGGRTPAPAAEARSAGRSRQQPVAARRPAPPEVDLLDFGSLSTVDAVPDAPNPPSAAPSPTLDLFRHVKQGQNLNHMTGGGGAGVGNGGRCSPVQQQHQQRGTMSKDDILAMFHTPQASSPQQQQQQHSLPSGPFGAGTSNNVGSTAAYGNGNSNPAMMQNAMMMNGQMANNFAADPNNNAMMMMMMNNQQVGMMPNGVAAGNNPMMMNPMNTNTSANQMIQNQMMMNGMNPGMMFPMGMPNAMMHEQQQPNPQQQQQQPMLSAVPMGGTPSNLNVMGGMSTGHAGAGASHSAGAFNGSGMNNRMGNPGGHGQVVADSGNAASDCTTDPFETFGDFRSF